MTADTHISNEELEEAVSQNARLIGCKGCYERHLLMMRCQGRIKQMERVIDNLRKSEIEAPIISVAMDEQ